MPEDFEVAIRSDFLDYYDHAFAYRYGKDNPFLWDRFADGDFGLCRSLAFEHMEKLGFNVVKHGLVKDLCAELLEGKITDNLIDLIVYIDSVAHRGEGKVKMPVHEALRKYPDRLASQHIPSVPGPGSMSYRYLCIGRRGYLLRYSNPDDWRSNYGPNVTVEVLGCLGDLSPEKLIACRYPMFAVDLIPCGKKLMAVDFNTAPGLKGTGIENICKPSKVYELVREAIWIIRGGCNGD